jgi:hypothetical protein
MHYHVEILELSRYLFSYNRHKKADKRWSPKQVQTLINL